MEEFLTNAFSTGDIKVILVAALLYLIIYVQRNNTKKARDEKSDDTDKRISVLESKIEKIDELDIATKLAQIQTDLSWIKEKLK